MKVKVYTREWFYNAGMIGFLRILEHAEKKFVKMEENYIEFDTKDLKDFHHDYFQYFFDMYNVAERTRQRIEISFGKIKSYLENINENKEIQDKIKTEKKYIKTVIKSQLDKIKKIDEKTYNIMLEAYNQIDEIKEKEQIEKLENIQKILTEEIEKEKINKTITMNLFKSILSKNYFGQPSFLNVVKTGLSFEEQEEVMYKDYISNMIETDFMQEILNGKYTILQIKEKIEEKQKDTLITREMLQIYRQLMKKYIEKESSLEEIQHYIQERVFSDCHMCENKHAMTSQYSESNFAALAISSDNMKNFFWNQNAELTICDICKLILFCIPAGVTSITKIVKENVQGKMVYKEKELLSFVNYDTSVEMLLKTNQYFSGNARYDKHIHNPYSDLILNIVEQEKEISSWQLENILVVEFETEYGAYSRTQYFHIKRYVAKFFVGYANSLLNLIKDYTFRLQIVDNILKNKDIKYIINDRLDTEIKKENPFGFYTCIATKIRETLQLLKKEDLEVEEQIKKNNAKISILYDIGVQIHEELKSKGEGNKLNAYTYKMLNAIRAGNRSELMDIILRIHISMGKSISPIFLEIMKDTDLDFEAVGHSFLSGLISNKLEKKQEVKENG